MNGRAEMAFAFRAAGFDAIDVHMSDILDGFSLDGFRGLVACTCSALVRGGQSRSLYTMPPERPLRPSSSDPIPLVLAFVMDARC